jgi:predicted ATPase
MRELIGRETQFQALHDAFDRVVAGVPQIVLVSGEPGIGKSYLVKTFIDEMSKTTPNVVIASDVCSTVSGGPGEPYGPFLEILSTITDERSDNEFWRLIRKAVMDLGPDWIAAIPVVGNVASATIRTAHWGKREWDAHVEAADANSRPLQLTRVLRQAGEAVPLLLWIDDLHWADAATIDLISFLANHLDGARVMLVASYRTTDPKFTGSDPSAGLKRLVSRLTRYGKCLEITIPSFTLEQLREYVASEHIRFPEDFVVRLFRQSGGNPLFVAEYLRLLVQRQLLRFTIEGFELVGPQVEIEIPGSVQTVINERLEILSAELYEMISYASVQGEHFASLVLAHLVHGDELKVLARLNELECIHHIVQELPAEATDPGLGTEYQFIHALIQRSLYDKLGKGQRRKVHLRIAQLLQELYAEKASAHATELAHHFEHGGDPEAAVRYYSIAAANGLASLALEDAEARAEDVLRLACELGNSSKSHRWRLESLLLLAEVRHLKAQFRAAIQACEEGAALAQREGAESSLARFLYWHSLSLYREGDVGASVPLVRKAISILGENSGDHRLLALLYVRLGASYRVLPAAEAKQALFTAIAMAQGANLPDVKATALTEMAGIAVNHDFAHETALAYAEEAFQITRQQGLIYEQLRALEWLSHASRFLQRGTDAIRYDQQAVEIALRSGLPRAQVNAYHCLANSQREVSHDWCASLETARKAVEIADRFQFPIVYGVFTDWFNAAFGLGLWDEARQAQARNRQLLETYSSYVRQWGFYWWREGLIAYTHGRCSEAIDQYEKALAAFGGESLSERDVNYVLPDLALARMSCNEGEGACTAIDSALAYWQTKDAAWHARCLRVRSCIDMTLGDPTQALARLQLALPLSTTYAYHPWPDHAHVPSNLALALLMLSRPAEALDFAWQGYRGLKQIGHFLTGEAAYIMARVLAALGRTDESERYLAELFECQKQLGLLQSPLSRLLSQLEER